MKRSLVHTHFRLLLLLILLKPPTDAFGQNILIKGGLNMSSVAGIRENASFIGYHIGIGGRKEISSNLSIKHELIFSQQGARISKDHKLAYYYLNIPILLNARLGEKFLLAVGPQAGIALRGLEKGERDADVTANLRTVDLSFCLGLSYLINEGFFVEGRYNAGLTNLSRISESDHRHAVFQGSIGYYFNRKSQ